MDNVFTNSEINMAMGELLLAIDEDEERVKRQIQTLINRIPEVAASRPVTVLYVFSENPAGASVAQIQSARIAEDRLQEAGISVTLTERSGDPATEILEYTKQADVDLICLAGRKRSPTGKALFGSVTQDVILRTKLPVLIAEERSQE